MFKKTIKWLAESRGCKLFHKRLRNDAGWDLSLPKDFKNDWYDKEPIVDFGVHVQIPKGYCALLCPRSSFAHAGGKLEIGVIDADYIGSIKGKFHCIPQGFEAGDRVAQLVFLKCANLPVVEADRLIERGRGLNGFGSTGK